MKLALFTPLNPRKSGISDYIEELLPILKSEFSLIDLFIEDYEPATDHIRESFETIHYLRFEEMHNRKRYDVILYQLGNSEYHKYIVGFLDRYPGVLLLHDFNLHHLMAEVYKHVPDRKAYLEEAEYNHGSLCRQLLSTTIEHTQQEFQLFYYPMNRRILESALGIIVHSNSLLTKIETTLPGKPVQVVPHHFWVDHQADEHEVKGLRQKHDLNENDMVVACMGNIIPSKEPVKIAEVCRRISENTGNLVLVFGGKVHNSVDVDKILRKATDNLRIIITGYLTKPDFETWLRLAHVIVNIRYPTTGETSGSLIKSMGLGKPLIISDLEQYRDFPDDVCARVDIGDDHGEELENAIRSFLEDDEFRELTGTRAREHIARFHSIESSAQGIADFTKHAGKLSRPGKEEDTGFLVKAERFGLIDFFAKETIRLTDDIMKDEVLDIFSSMIEDFEE